MNEDLVDLTKKVEVVLTKRGVKPTVKAQVGFAIDVSGSMKDLYRNGTMQQIVNRIQGLANRFDDNSTLDMWAFHTRGFELEAAVPSMFGSYVEKYVLTHNDLWGGTSFAPVTELIEDHYFGKTASKFGLMSLFKKKEEKPTDPVYLIFLTDGDNDDEKATTELISNLASKNIFIQFVGVGRGSSFRYIRSLGSKFDYVGFEDFSDPGSVSDEQMYDKLLNPKFISWITR